MDKSLSSNSEYKNNSLFCITSKESNRRTKTRKLEYLRSKQGDYKQSSSLLSLFTYLLSLISNLLKAGLPRQLSLARNDGYRSRFGFTLAEALIITVMTGICILPIVGTMQNAQQRTQNFDHQSKMERYSRSKLNEVIAKAAFDHEDIKENEETEYHYIVDFAKGSTTEDGKAVDAKLVELPKTKDVKLEDFINYINEISNGNNSNSSYKPSVYNLLGLTSNIKKPYLNIVHAYKTVVEIKENPPLTTTGTNPDVETPNSLLGIVVRTSLIYSNEQNYNEDNGYLKKQGTYTDTETTTDDPTVQVPPVSLFAFVNLPAKGESTMWLADAENLKIYGIDPTLRTISDVIDCPKNIVPNDNDSPAYKPFYIAIHPNQKLLAYQTKKYIFLVNIDKNSGDNYLKVKYLCDSSSPAEVQKGGIAFRPDGKYLFALNDISGIKLTAFELDYSLDSSNKLNWKEDPTEKPKLIKLNDNPYISFNTNNLSGFVTANDGYLYIVCNSSDNTSEITRVPMYPSSFTDGWNKELFDSFTQAINSIDVSPDGTRLAVLTNDNKLRVYDTRDSRFVLEELNITDSNLDNPNKITYLAISSATKPIYDPKNLNLFISNDANETNNDIVRSIYIDKYSIKPYDEYKKIKPLTGIYPTNLIAISPDNKTVVVTDSKKNNLYISNDTESNSEVLSENNILKVNDSMKVIGDDTESTFSDLASTKIDPLAVAHGNEVDIFDLNTFSIVGSFTSDKDITSLSMNPQGDMLIGGHGRETSDFFADNNHEDRGNTSKTQYTRFHLTDFATSTIDVTGHGKKTAFDDRTPNMAFVLELPTGNTDKENAFYNINSKKLPGSNDPYLKDWEFKERNNAYTRSDFDLPPNWHRLDMIGLPRGGAMALYGKDDGSSMLEWIGRRTWKHDPNEGKYKLFARWTNIKTDYGFPTVFNFYEKNGTAVNSSAGAISIIKTSLNNYKTMVFKYVNLKTGNWGDNSKRYITPILFEKSSDDRYYPKDYAESLELEKNKIYYDLPLKWNNGGKIYNDYYIGFWNGGKASGAGPNKGVITYYPVDSLIYTRNSFLNNTDTWWSLTFDQVTNTSNHFKENNDGVSKRVYLIKFNFEKTSSFPPFASKKLAITPDQTTLAILSEVEEKEGTQIKKTPTLNLYDFNKNIYGPETQLEGMLVDYREPQTSESWIMNRFGGYRITPAPYPWPEETGESLFKKVSNNYRLNTTKITKLRFLTTKYTNFWDSFNSFPANISVGSGLSISNIENNKRFIGYIRPEFYAMIFQTYYTEDYRYFFNKIFKYGALYENGGAFIMDKSKTIINNEAYDSNLLQIDQTFNGSSMSLGSFLSNKPNPNDLKNTSYLGYESGHLLTSHPDYKTLRSEQTYILKNQPTFMGSFKLKKEDTIKLDLTKPVYMCYSRDKAKPALYISDTDREAFWVFYRNRIVRLAESDVGTIGNFVISNDGQKLLYCRKEGKSINLPPFKYFIKYFDISNPNVEDSFKTYNKLPDTKLFKNQNNGYMRQISSITFELNEDTTPILATKPHTSFNSAKIGGEYKEITKPEDLAGNKITWDCSLTTNGSMTVASGGIYIYNGEYDFLCYNPITNVASFSSKVLKDKSIDSPVTVYDDTIYIFGSSKGDSSDSTKPTNWVQSYNVNTNFSMKSLIPTYTDEYNDSYQVNMTIPNKNSGNNTPTNFGYSDSHYGDIGTYITSNYITNVSHAFTAYTGDYAFSNSGNPEIILNFDNPLTCNKFTISNKRASIWSIYGPSKKIKLVGINNLGIETVLFPEQNIGEYDENTFYESIISENLFKSYKFSFSSGSSKAINLIQLWRTGVKRLTPGIKGLSSSPTLYNQNITSFSHNGAYIEVSNIESGYGLQDIYIMNEVENNYFKVSTDGWETKQTSPWICVSLDNPEAVCALQLANSGKSGTKRVLKFKLYGSNKNERPNISDGISQATDDGTVQWAPINFTSTNASGEIAEFTVPRPKSYSDIVYDTYVTAEIKDPQKYKHYLFQITESGGGSSDNTDPVRLIGFELYAKNMGLVNLTTDTDNDSITPLQTDDLGEVKVGAGACCSTPYGLVYTGGHVNGTGDNYATTTALLYWPHAVNKYDGTYYQYGICRSLPDMNVPRYGHALVWHKGKIYAIGGKKSNNGNNSDYVCGEEFIECLDYNKSMSWENIPSNSYIVTKIDNTDFSTEAKLHEFQKRANFGACSFRDEIFIFSGDDGISNDHPLAGRSSAFAWNPETGIFRKINDTVITQGNTTKTYKFSPCAAVPFGSKIYIYGKDNNDSGKYKMLEYTP